MWVELPEQLVLPQVQHGVDYGVRRPVLAQRSDRALILAPGHSYWAGRGEYRYAPATYELVHVQGDSWGLTEELFTGRFSRAKLLAAAPRIAAWLGCRVDELPDIRRNRTYVWQDACGNTP